MSDDRRVFISYSTRDGSAFAKELRNELEQAFSVWQDLVALKGGDDWWSQIEAALRSPGLQHFVIVVTPGALDSAVVRREIRLARQEGKTVSPVEGPNMPPAGTLPRWLGQVYDLKRPEHRTTFFRVLEAPSQAKRVPMMAPEPPDEFIPRPMEFDALKSLLLDEESGDAVAITAALQGAGGYGKTTLARALAHDPDVLNAYYDGILWVELGEQGGDQVHPVVSDLVKLITGALPEVATIHGARTALGEALGDRRMLLVIDDVWQKHDLEPFLHGGRNATRLVTTRFDRVLPPETRNQTVDAMKAGEALSLIGWGLPDAKVRENAPALASLAVRLGEWALLLKLANGFLRGRVNKLKSPLETALADVNRRLDARGMTVLDRTKAKTYEARGESVAAMMLTSLELLDSEEKRDRYAELAVFPEDADIPVGIVKRLWREICGLDEIDSEDLLAECLDLSLLLSIDMERGVLRFHDTVRQFLRDQAGPERLEALTGQLLGALDAPEGLEERRYKYRYLPEHLAEASERERLDDLLLDPAWLTAKLDALKSPLTLVADYDRHGSSATHDLIGRTLRLSSGICVRDQLQLVPQLLGRLMAARPALESGLIERLENALPKPCLRSVQPSLTPPGAETTRLEGHAEGVNSLALLWDGRLASGSDDNTVRLWDPESGRETACLAGHMDRVTALAVLQDGRLASGSSDTTVRLWDPQSGQETDRLEGPGMVTALAVLQDGRLASAALDKTVRLWDPVEGQETSVLEGHSGAVRALAVLRDGRLASGSSDATVRLWNPDSGQEVSRLEGHMDSITALAVLQDGRLASGSSDATLRLWDLDNPQETVVFEGHSGAVSALAVLRDGRLASGSGSLFSSGENKVILWDPVGRRETASLEGHVDRVTTLAVLQDGRLASGALDKTVRLWNPESDSEIARLKGHSGAVTALVVSPDGCLASGSWDDTVRWWDPKTGRETARLEGVVGRLKALAVLPDGRWASEARRKVVRLWDPENGREMARLRGHSGGVTALAMLPDGRLASGALDKTVRLWNLESGRESACLEGHEGWVTSLAVLQDGRLASGSYDETVRLWDPKSGRETTRLEGHEDQINALAVLRSGRLASGASDNTVRLWDPKSGQEIDCLEGHKDRINALAALRNGRLVSGSSDNTVRLWDPKSGREITRLEVDAVVLCLAALPNDRIVVGDQVGQIHWIDLIE